MGHARLAPPNAACEMRRVAARHVAGNDRRAAEIIDGLKHAAATRPGPICCGSCAESGLVEGQRIIMRILPLPFLEGETRARSIISPGGCAQGALGCSIGNAAAEDTEIALDVHSRNRPSQTVRRFDAWP
jgi:hypothetical protein